MARRVLTVNCGSSSLKTKLFQTADDGGLTAVAGALVQRVGRDGATLTVGNGAGPRPVAAPDHAAALLAALPFLGLNNSAQPSGLAAVGHRVVHGGPTLAAPSLWSPAVAAAVAAATHLAPLHNPANVTGVTAAQAAFPGVPQVAVFDTAFHVATLPPAAWTYALPVSTAEQHGLRKYGFHGTSYAYLVRRAAAHLALPLPSLHAVALHLGAGASACCVRGGVSVDTSMGATPLAGLVMATRCGDVDPAVPLLLQEATGTTPAAVSDMLNKQSGLAALAGAPGGDLRDVLAARRAGDAHARAAFDVYVHRIRHYVGAYLVALGGEANAILFTGGVGEGSPDVRAAVLAGLEAFGVVLDPGANARAASPEVSTAIHAPHSRLAVLVVPADEELAIAEQALTAIGAGGGAAAAA